jgi:hypothetical protein
LVFHAYIIKCTVQEANLPVKNLGRQLCVEGFNSGVEGLNFGNKMEFVSPLCVF